MAPLEDLRASLAPPGTISFLLVNGGRPPIPFGLPECFLPPRPERGCWGLAL